MKQIVIKELLDEAALPETKESRIVEILELFGDSIIHSYENGLNTESARITIHKLLINDLIKQAERNRPLFPHLFPIVAALCGDRDHGSLPAKIDVSLMNLDWSLIRNAE